MKNIVKWVKAHIAIVIGLIAVIVVAILVINFATGSEKREIKKYLSALNSGNAQKIIDVQDLKATIAWENGFYVTDSGEERSGIEFIKNFEDAINSVSDEEVTQYENDIKELYSDGDVSEKIKLVKIIYSTQAVDNSDLKKVVCKVRVSTEPENEVDEEPVNTDEYIDDSEEYADEEIENTEEEDEIIDTDEEAIDEEIEYTEEETGETEEEELEESEAGSEYESEEDMWKVNKKFTEVTETYATFYLYKGKVIGMNFGF